MAQYVVRRKSDGLYLSDELNINVVCEGINVLFTDDVGKAYKTSNIRTANHLVTMLQIEYNEVTESEQILSDFEAHYGIYYRQFIYWVNNTYYGQIMSSLLFLTIFFLLIVIFL